MGVQFDPQSIISRITTNLQKTVSFSKILFYSANLRLIQAFSEELSNLANFDIFLTRETKWSLAQNTSSLLSAESIHRYNAYRKIGAFGQIRFAISDAITSADWLVTTTYNADDIIYYSPDPITIPPILYKALRTTSALPTSLGLDWALVNISPLVNVDIPKWTVFSDQTGNFKFTSYTSQALTVGENFIDIDVVQGTPKSQLFTALGLANEEFLVTDATIENYRFELYVNGILWTSVNNLLDYGSGDKVYYVENILDFSGIYLEFGDNIYGQQLSNGDTVAFYYVSTSGSLGNVNSSSIVIKVNSTIYDTNNNTVTAFCTNLSSLLGGTEVEGIESIRLNAPKIFQTGDRASSADDYVAIIQNNFSFILKVNVWGAYEYAIDNNLDPWDYTNINLGGENVVHVAAISTSGTNLTRTQQLLISQGINQYKAPTDIVTYETVRFLNLAFITTAYVSDTSFTLSSVTNGIRSALASAYSINALALHQNVYFSDYQALIDNVAGVDHHTTYAQIVYDFIFTSGSYPSAAFVCSMDLPSINIRQSSVNVYIQDTVGGQTDWTLIGIDLGNGSFNAETGYTLTGSSIDYNTGIAIIQVTSAYLVHPFTNYTIEARYRLQSDDLIIQNRSDIYSYSSTDSQISALYSR